MLLVRLEKNKPTSLKMGLITEYEVCQLEFETSSQNLARWLADYIGSILPRVEP